MLIEELHTDGWHIGGRPFEGPKSLMETLGNSKMIFSIDSKPTSRKEFASAARRFAVEDAQFRSIR